MRTGARLCPRRMFAEWRLNSIWSANRSGLLAWTLSLRRDFPRMFRRLPNRLHTRTRRPLLKFRRVSKFLPSRKRWLLPQRKPLLRSRRYAIPRQLQSPYRCSRPLILLSWANRKPECGHSRVNRNLQRQSQLPPSRRSRLQNSKRWSRLCEASQRHPQLQQIPRRRHTKNTRYTLFRHAIRVSPRGSIRGANTVAKARLQFTGAMWPYHSCVIGGPSLRLLRRRSVRLLEMFRTARIRFAGR